MRNSTISFMEPQFDNLPFITLNEGVEKCVREISDKDKYDWLKFINNKEEIEDKDRSIKENAIIQQKILDLHGYTIRDANLAVSNLILSSYNKGVKKLKIITGKGMRSNNLNDPYKSKDLSKSI